MKTIGLVLVVISELSAQTSFSPCDINQDGAVNVADVQLMVDQVLGTAACTANLDGTGTCDVADVQRVIVAALGGVCDGSSPSTITLPIEVVGPAGTIETVSVVIPPAVNLSGPQTLWMQIHGLRYEGKASVQVNNSPWVDLTNETVTLLGQSAAYGGIGGGFNTHKMTLALPQGTLVTGTNTVSFRFNKTQGGLGFRVLQFNFLEPDGSMLIPSSTFVEDDPNTWQPPLTSAADIAAGKTLFQTASIIHAGVPVLAHCNNCHTQDGRDLKYFNYSNKFLHYGGIVSGLTDQQADQIASYIRSIDFPNPGRPWNPPYQPGPGLDSQPVSNWAAGAGLDAVLDSDQDLVNELFPNGIQNSTFAATGNLNVRETAIPLQLLDWNHWLPTESPMDAWSDFEASAFNQDYSNIRAALVPGSATAYTAAKPLFDQWTVDYIAFEAPKTPNNGGDPSFWTPQYVTNVYALAQWLLVKSWELNHEFELEGMPSAVFSSPQADPRAWYSQFPFFASPNMLHLPPGLPGLDNGTVPTFYYLAYLWYHIQLILNNSNKQQVGTDPIDWGYSYGFVNDLAFYDSPGQAGLFALWYIKGLQIECNGKNPASPNPGQWQFIAADPTIQVDQEPKALSVWTGVPAANQTAIYTGSVRAFLDVVEQFTPQEFYAGGYTTASEVPPAGQMFGDMAARIWYAIPVYHYYGVSQSLINEFANWAKTIWPNGNWALTTTASCTPGNTGVSCSTE